ncbi:predicted protein [Nematostella vectensis]|uniref:Uncharacterized protein n=1 Tax=Nematostella vectensis TaxID=45351 RepID=A7SS02_NEMVE|nr:predicted protein [Nematostella vectensis]|eukprot:XP_001625620.1 predicted protein [Nematostella vectensis]
MSKNSFKAVQESLLFSLEERIIDKEEFAVLFEEYTPQNLPFCHWDYEEFCLENKDPAECKADFRFEKRDIPLLVDALQMPDTFTCVNGTVCDATEGLCVVLKRFAYPCRLSDMISIFGRSVPELSMICNEVTEWIYNAHHHRTTEWNNFILSPNSLQTYADAIHNKAFKNKQFQKEDNKYLNVTEKDTFHVDKVSQCAVKSLKDDSLLSFNFKKERSNDGKYLCEVLRTDRYINWKNYTDNAGYQHFNAKVECSSGGGGSELDLTLLEGGGPKFARSGETRLE